MQRIRRISLPALSLLVFVTASGVFAQDATTLTVWDNWTREVDSEMIETLNAEFEAANPGVTIEREVYETSDLTELLPLALSEASGPDVAMINQGIANMGPLVEAGLLLPLDDYAAQYGWLDRYGEGLHQRNSFTEGATQFGEGNLYGVSNTAEVVGVFYHRDMFEEMGLEVPTTFDEFQTLLQTVKDAGMTPIIFGSLDGWNAIHEYSAIANAFTTTDDLDNLIFRFEGGTFNDDANLTAAQTLKSWVDNGYFPEGFEGMDHDNAMLSAFINKEGPMMIAGSWVASGLIDALGAEEVGFFLVPSATEEVPIATGGVGLAYGISANSDNPDLAAEYIDFITGPRAAELITENGLLAAGAVDASALEEGTLLADITNAWNTIASNDKVGHYLDWTIPYDDVVASLQELLGGQITPEEFVANVEQSYVDSAP